MNIENNNTHTLINNKIEGKWPLSLQLAGCYTVQVADIVGPPSHAAPQVLTKPDGASAYYKPLAKQQRCPHKGSFHTVTTKSGDPCRTHIGTAISIRGP